MNWILFFFLGLLSSCGYKCSFQEEERVLSVQVPYIQGDVDAQLNNELVYQLAACGRFSPVKTGGDVILKITILSTSPDKI